MLRSIGRHYNETITKCLDLIKMDLYGQQQCGLRLLCYHYSSHLILRKTSELNNCFGAAKVRNLLGQNV